MSTDRLRRSWIANAAAWRDAVRERRIESRRVATDAAIVDAVLAQQPRTVLDLGCGEGWLARALAAHGVQVTGVDASPDLVAAAQEQGGGTFQVLAYDELATLGARYDVAVANFSLLEEDLQPLAALAADTLIIQTVHPASIEEASRDGWRVETFAAMEGEWREPMPWYFRTIASWVATLAENGWSVTETREPLHPETQRPLSVIFICQQRRRA
ncbi:MAG TPA: methyltransferase domain-containing protein [Thermoanaerobaculia bacterium]|nr:methyltransferase domain-containing protein [Thermoanaerobaculia bacterium]